MVQFDDNLPSLADDDVSIATLDLTIGNLVDIINNHLDAVLSTHLDGTVPSYATDGMLWLEEVTTNEMWILHAHYANGGYDVEIGTIDLGETEGIFKASSVNFDNLDEVTDIETTDYIIIQDSSDEDNKVVKVLVQELEEMLTSDNDELVKVNSSDTTAGYLEGKLEAGDNITFTTADDNSTITIASSGGDAELDINGLTDSLTHEDVADADLFVVSDVSTDDNDLKKITVANLRDYVTETLNLAELGQADLTENQAPDFLFVLDDYQDAATSKSVSLGALTDYITTNLNFSELGDHHTALDDDGEFIVDTGSIQRITFSHLKERVLQTSNIGSLSLADLDATGADNYLLWLDDNSSGDLATNKSVSLSRLATYFGSGGGDAELDINGLTNALTDSTIADGDLFAVSDVSTDDNEVKKITAEDLAEYMTDNISLGAGLRFDGSPASIVLDIRSTTSSLVNVVEEDIGGGWVLPIQNNTSSAHYTNSITVSNLFNYFGEHVIEDLASDADPIAHEIVSVSSDGENFYRTSLSTLVNHVAFENLDINGLDALTTIADDDQFVVSDTLDGTDSNVVKKITASDLRDYFQTGSSSNTVTFSSDGVEGHTVTTLHDTGIISIGGYPSGTTDVAHTDISLEHDSLLDTGVGSGELTDTEELLRYTARILIFFTRGDNDSRDAIRESDEINFARISGGTVRGAIRDSDGTFSTTGSVINTTDHPYSQRVIAYNTNLIAPIRLSQSEPYPMVNVYNPESFALQGLYLRRTDTTAVNNGYYLPMGNAVSGDDSYRYFQLSHDGAANTARLSYMRLMFIQ